MDNLRGRGRAWHFNVAYLWWGCLRAFDDLNYLGWWWGLTNDLRWRDGSWHLHNTNFRGWRGHSYRDRIIFDHRGWGWRWRWGRWRWRWRRWLWWGWKHEDRGGLRLGSWR